MSYTPTMWETGDVITAQKLNKMENAIHAILSDYEQTNWSNGDVISAEKLNKLENAIAQVNLDYIKTVWENGDVITASLLNNMESGIEIASVDKTWEEMGWNDIIAATRTGKYKDFNVGDMKELDLGPEGIVHMQIVGIDVDDLADGSGKAKLTFISHELLNTRHNMNSTNTTTGGWESTAMRTYLKNTIKPLIPATVAAGIKEVTKYSKSVDPANNNATTTDDVWIPSVREIFGGTYYELSGPDYTDLFDSASAKIKNRNGIASNWWLRSAFNATNFRCVRNDGSTNSDRADSTSRVALGFCL